jgi:DNA-binding winged helix-turn-helix (wHTH) protein
MKKIILSLITTFYIYNLRKKLGTRYIKTVPGFGYCLKADGNVCQAEFCQSKRKSIKNN